MTAKTITPIEAGFAVTPHDTNALSAVTRAIYVGTGGDVKVQTVGGNDLTFSNVADGSLIPIRIDMVYSTGTTASDILGLY